LIRVKAYGYRRVSTKNQSKDGYSLDEQSDQIERYCKENNLNLVGIFTDAAKSGATVDEEEMTVSRDGLQDMLANIKENDVGLIVVLNTSRLWRSDSARYLIHKSLKKLKADVKSIDQPQYSIYEKDPNNALINGMLELLDYHQRGEITAKLSRGRHKKASLGGYSGGGAPIGYKASRGSKVLEVDADKALTVQRVFEIRQLCPEQTLQMIANVLNDEGHTTKNGNSFKPMQIKRILDRKELYAGVYTYSGVEANGLHAAII